VRQVHPDVDELDGHAFSRPFQDTRRELAVHWRVRMRLRGSCPARSDAKTGNGVGGASSRTR
jgi:hypothetical protein